MKRKILCLLLVITALLSLSAFSVSASPLPALDVLSSDLTLAKCGLLGHTLSFDPSDFDDLTQSQTQSITVLTLPAPESGTLYLAGRALDPFTEIAAKDLTKLTFEPACDKENACRFTFRKESEAGDYLAVCRLYMLPRLNFAPTLSATDSEGNLVGCTTYGGITTVGSLSATDPEGDSLRFEILSYPEKGSVTLSGCEYRYTAFAGSEGEDHFSVIAIDRYGNRSESAEIPVTVLKRESNLSYTDMEGHPAYVAALAMSYCGAMTGSVIGGEAVFAPDDTINCIEFVAALQTAMGMDVKEAQDTSLPAGLPDHLVPFVTTALANGWLEQGHADASEYLSPVTRGKAATILCLAMQINTNPIPGVAADEQALAVMAGRGILPLADGALCPDLALTRAEAAMAILAVLDRM